MIPSYIVVEYNMYVVVVLFCLLAGSWYVVVNEHKCGKQTSKQ
jgi:hypothetical protein